MQIMPRQPRIEYEDAMYHVLNRGNYRNAIFSVETSAELFEEVLFNTCGRFGKEAGEALLSIGLARLGKTEQNIESDRKGIRWKIVLGS